MDYQEYHLKGSDAYEIFKKILENIRGLLEVVQFYKLADDYAPLILSNPNSTPEILFEEDLNEVVDEHKVENNYAVYGNLDYGERSILYLMVFVDKILAARLYSVIWQERNESKLSVQFKNQFDNKNLDIYKKVVDLITDVVKEKTLFKE